VIEVRRIETEHGDVVGLALTDVGGEGPRLLVTVVDVDDSDVSTAELSPAEAGAFALAAQELADVAMLHEVFTERGGQRGDRRG
jgi:hypothetical protein